MPYTTLQHFILSTAQHLSFSQFSRLTKLVSNFYFYPHSPVPVSSPAMLLYSTLAILLLLRRQVSALPSDSDGQDDLVHQISDKIDNNTRDSDNQTTVHDENHPLLTVMETKPHSMSLMVKPKDYKPDTMIRLLYERVPQHRKPIMQHLNDPVIEYIPLTRRVQSHNMTELPMGKYTVKIDIFSGFPYFLERDLKPFLEGR